jgi:hypothetical protein
VGEQARFDGCQTDGGCAETADERFCFRAAGAYGDAEAVPPPCGA